MGIWIGYRPLTKGGWAVFAWLAVLILIGTGAYGLYFCWTVDTPPEYAADLRQIRLMSYGCVTAGLLGIAGWFAWRRWWL